MLIPLGLLLMTQGPGDSISLGEALARARAMRGQVTVAAAQVAEARAALRGAGAITNPTVSYSHSGAVPQEHFLFNQPLDFLLRRGPERSAARARIAGAQADSSLTMANLAREVRTAFYRALVAAGGERLVSEQAGQADSVARIAAARLRAGDVSLLEQETGGSGGGPGAPDAFRRARGCARGGSRARPDDRMGRRESAACGRRP